MTRRKELKSGYTTGTCAAIAAKAAASMIFSEDELQSEQIMTPKGILVKTKIYDIQKNENRVSCAVQKDAGDDPDVTHGILIYAQVELKREPDIVIDGGTGVGRVTKSGLSQEIGEAAINPVPKRMIEKEVREVLDSNGYLGGANVIISVPEGEQVAKKTFNPRLGIVNGISILGTTGIVEPMSERALIDTIKVEMQVLKANGLKNLLITPGNYGENFIKETLHLDLKQAVTCSNFVGEAIDYAVDMGFENILLIGHVGKFVKLAAGIMNTHSHQADGRMEVFTAHAALAGAEVKVLEKIMDCISTDEAIRVTKEYGFYESMMESILRKADFHITQRCMNEVPIGAIFFSNVHGILGMTDMARKLLPKYTKLDYSK